VHDAVAHELRVVQRRDHRKNALLLREFEVCLKAHDIIDGARRVVLSQLHDSVRFLPRPGVLQPDRLQGPVAQRVKAAARHDLHGHATLEHLAVLEAVHLGGLGRRKRLHKGGVFLLVHRAVYIICISAVVAGGKPGLVHVDGLKAYKRRGRVEKAHVVLTAEVSLDSLAERVGGERTGCNDDRSLRDLRHLAGLDRDERVGTDFLGHHPGKAVPVDRQRAAGVHAVGLGALEDEAAEPPQFFLQKADRVLKPVSPQGIGTHQLGKIRTVMRWRIFLRLHLDEAHRYAPPGKLPGGFASGETRADDGYFLCHSASFFAAGFLAAVFFTAGFFAADFFSAVFFAALFLAAGFLSSGSPAGSAGFPTSAFSAAGLRR